MAILLIYGAGINFYALTLCAWARYPICSPSLFQRLLASTFQRTFFDLPASNAQRAHLA